MTVALLKEKLRDAKLRAEGLSSGQPLQSNDEGLFGIGSIVAVIILISVTLAVLGGFQFIMKQISGGLSLGKLLVHIPPFDPSNLDLVTFPELAAEETTGLFHASIIMSDLYMLFVTLAFAVMAIAFVVIGLSYALESFNIVPRNTAEKLLSESVLVLVLIFLFPWFFNMGAIALNTVNEDMIMQEGDTDYQEMVNYVAEQTAEFPGIAMDIPVVGRASQGITALVCATATFTSLIIALSMGTFKLLATGAFAVAFPLLLTLRLIPITRNLANKLMQGLIGILMASLVMALFFRFSWGLLHAMEPGSVMRWALATTTMIAAAGALTITARVFYGITRMVSGTIGRSVAGAVAGYAATGATAGLGGAAGMAMGGKSAVAGAQAGGMGGGGALRTIGRAGIAGAAAGGPGRSITGSIGKGAGAGREVGGQMLAKEGIPAKGDIEVTQGNINAQMDNVTSERIGGLGGEAKQKLAAEGKSISERGIDNLSDKRVLDAYGRHLEEQGEMRSYNPEQHREALRKNVSPDEIREGLKGSLSDMKDQTPQGDQRAYGTPGAGEGSSNDEAYARLGAYLSGSKDLQKDYGPGGGGEGS